MVEVLYVVEPGTRIGVRKGSVIIVGRDGKVGVAPPNIESVIIASSRVSISSRAIRLLASRGINVTFLDPMGHPIAMLFPPVVNKTVLTRVRQYELFLSKEVRLELARRIVGCKIENQARLVRYLARNRSETSLNEVSYMLSSMAAQLMNAKIQDLTADAIMSVEAQAANKYWDAIAVFLPQNLGFHGRNPDSVDPMNVALNYGYGILYSAAEKYLLMAGLDPYLGVLHSLKSGKPSLVFDFVEPFRPIAVDKPLVMGIDGLGIKLINGLLDYDSRRVIAKLVLNNLDREYVSQRTRRKAPLIEHIKHETWYLASIIREGSISDYKCFTWVF